MADVINGKFPRTKRSEAGAKGNEEGRVQAEAECNELVFEASQDRLHELMEATGQTGQFICVRVIASMLSAYQENEGGEATRVLAEGLAKGPFGDG
jgi:hypothetical protein